ncbi:hypothetical protein HUK80_10015 [Flavobacterium sp. MAH-1]|uniref:Transcription elongation factor n=1 Tax=Flavobacterium agri TaxID=2743471 RepID=A0A7Y9C6A4_9FLAO|nr:hypothetical protein [Flavobacterium agri]NUY81230.1 hypothetical protein [Flavobacterium agri]NYA71254.1 hypothetical protein [Flavobacterium agri]
MTLKQKVYARYQQLVSDKIDAFRDMISALSEDAQNDAKSSAGDKHETALSMMHLEQEKLNLKLAECLEQKAILDKIDPESTNDKVVLGSLVVANGIHLFLSAALPKVVIDGVSILALSPQSPLGSKLVGKSIGGVAEVNTSTYTIERIS